MDAKPDDKKQLGHMIVDALAGRTEHFVELLAEVNGKLDTIMAEQKRQALALGEAGIIVLDHKKNIESQGAAIVRIWHELGLPIQDAPQPGPVN